MLNTGLLWNPLSNPNLYLDKNVSFLHYLSALLARYEASKTLLQQNPVLASTLCFIQCFDAFSMAVDCCATFS